MCFQDESANVRHRLSECYIHHVIHDSAVPWSIVVAARRTSARIQRMKQRTREITSPTEQSVDVTGRLEVCKTMSDST